MTKAILPYKQRKEQLIKIAAKLAHECVKEEKTFNLTDVAEAAEVNIGTVSRILANHEVMDEMLCAWANENPDHEHAKTLLEYELPIKARHTYDPARAEERKDQILQASIKIASQYGHNSRKFNGATIAAKAGTHSGAVWQLYGGMPELKKEIVSWCNRNKDKEESKRILAIYEVVGL